MQGTRDSLCPLDLIEGVRAEMRALNQLHVVEGGDHSLGVTRKQLTTDAETQNEVDARILNTIGEFVEVHAKKAADR